MKNQKGVAHILGLLLLVAGLGASVYLVQHETKLFSRAASAPIGGCKTDANCPPGYKCQIQATTLRECPSGVSAPACNTMVGKCVLIQAAKPIPSTKPSEDGSRVFVTSTTYNGNLGGLSGADAKCQTRANAASLAGTWKAWLSDSRTSAASRLIHNNGPYKLLNGTIIANNWADLTDGYLGNPIDVNEFKNNVSEELVWTDTGPDGNTYGTDPVHDSCSDWSYSTISSVSGYAGLTSPSSNFGEWTLAGSPLCNLRWRLYCFEQVSAGSAQTAVVSCSACTADLNKDGQVNIADFGKLASCMNKKSTDSAWNTCQAVDLNGDGQVNINDFSCIRSQYGKQCSVSKH